MLRHVDDLLSIGEFSQRSGLSPKRLRSYAAVGLLIPESVDASSGYRYYAPDQLRTARLIDSLREAGMPLADIGTLLRDPSGERLDAWATRVQVDAAQRQEALEVARGLLVIEPSTNPVPPKPPGQVTMTRLQAASRTEIGRVRE